MTSYSQKYLKGMYKLYTKLLAKNIYFSYLDVEKSKPTIYGEAKTKVYGEPIKLLGRIYAPTELGIQPVNKVEFDAVVRICTKSLNDNNVPHNPEDYDTLMGGKFTYDGRDYLITRIEPSDNVDDIYIFYDFYCSMPKVRYNGTV